MKCLYCSFFQESPTRFGKKATERFCNHVQRVVSLDKEMCEDGFEAHHTFWCDNANAWLDLTVCSARQSRGYPDCAKCRQKQVIMEIRRFMGRKARLDGTAPKPIVKKKESDEKVPEKPKPKIILHKKQPEEKPKPKMILHKKVKVSEIPKPIKKIIKK